MFDLSTRHSELGQARPVDEKRPSWKRRRPFTAPPRTLPPSGPLARARSDQRLLIFLGPSLEFPARKASKYRVWNHSSRSAVTGPTQGARRPGAKPRISVILQQLGQRKYVLKRDRWFSVQTAHGHSYSS